MAKLWKFAWITAVVLIALLVVAVAAINLVPGRHMKSLLTSGVKTATGRELVIDGDLQVRLLNTFAVKAEGVKFPNADWGTRPIMASIDRFKVEVALLPLLKGVLDASLVVDNPDLLLETNRDGRGNWQFGDAQAARETDQEGTTAEKPPSPASEPEDGAGPTDEGAGNRGGLPLQLLVRELGLNDIRFAYIDGQKGNHLDIHSDGLRTGAEDSEIALDLAGRYNDIPLALSVGMENNQLFIENRPAGVRLKGNFGDARLTAQGEIGPLSPTFDLDVTATLDTDSLAAFAPFTGELLPDIGPLSISTALTGKEGHYRVSDLVAKLDDPSVSVEAAGSVADLVALNGLSLAVTADTRRLNQILGLFGIKLAHPLPDSVVAKAKAEGSLKRLAITQFEAGVKGQGLSATLNGRVDNIMALEGVEADLTVEAASLDPIAAIAATPLPPFAPLTAKAHVAAKAPNLGQVVATLNLAGKSIQTDISGTVEDPFTLKGLNADVNLSATSLEWLKNYVAVPLPPLGRLQVSANIASDGNTLAVREIEAELAGGKVDATVSGSVGDLLKFKAVDTDIALGVANLNDLSEVAGTELPPWGPLRLDTSIASQGDALTAKSLKAALSDDKVKATVTGSVGDLLTFKGVDAAIDIGIASLDDLSEVAGTELPSLGPLALTAAVASQGDNFAASAVKAVLSDDKIQATVTGSVGDLLNLKAVNADVDIGVAALDDLSEIVKTELPPFGPLNLSATIASAGDTFAVKALKANLSDEKVQATVSGSVGDLLQFKAVDADIVFGVESLAVLSDLAKRELPPYGPLDLHANVASQGDTFTVRAIKVDFSGEKLQAHLAASVEDLLSVAGINADFDISVDNLTSLNPILNQQLPESAPVALKGKLSSAGLNAPLHIDTDLTSDGVTVNLSGKIDDPRAVDGVDIKLTAEADSMQSVGRLTGIQFVTQKPFKLKSTFTAANKAYSLSDLSMQAGRLDMKGHAAYTPAGETGGRSRLSGELHIGELDFSRRQTAKRERQEAKLDAAVEAGKEPEPVEKENEVLKEKVFPSEPLPLGPLRKLDVDFVLTVDRLNTLQLQLDHLVAKLALDDGMLRLAPLKAKVGDGTFDGTAMLDVRNTPALDADLTLRDATFNDFGGKLQFHVDLEGRGDSIAEIMAGLNGQFAFNVKEVSLKKSFMTGFGAGILDSLNPFDKNKETTELICAVLLFDIEDGIADANRKLAAQMTDVTWFGSGEINLKTEEIDFGMAPGSRKVLDLGMGGTLAKLIHIGGTLAQPKIQLDPKDIAIKTGKYAAAVATGGITLVADLLWSKIKANTDACTPILEKVQVGEEEEEGEKKEK